jgi:hypothetical protein
VSQVRRARHRHWHERCQLPLRQAELRAGHALLEYARELDDGFPPDNHLEADLRKHMELKRLIDRIDDALGRG